VEAGLITDLKQYRKEYWLKNKGILSKKAKEYYQNHKEDILKRQKLHNSTESKSEYLKKYYQLHKEEHARKSKEYRLNNKEKLREKAKQYYLSNGDKIKKSNKARRLKRDYDISLNDVKSILRDQNNQCPICFSLLDNKKWCIDHDHKSGKLRGFVCYSCNILLGMAQDNVDTLQNAIEYLERFKTV
jgi:hypothetical protein